MFTKPDQTLFPLKQDGEVILQLDTGHFVAVLLHTQTEPNTGSASITARARVVNADGGDFYDANAHTVTSEYSMNADAGYAEAIGGMPTLQARIVKIMIGEDPGFGTPEHPMDQTTLGHANIRTTLASAAFAGPPVADLIDLL